MNPSLLTTVYERNGKDMRIIFFHLAYAVKVMNMHFSDRKNLLLIWVLISFTGAVYFHEQVGKAVLEAGKRCISVILPSLYLFSILSVFMIKSGILEYFTRPLRKISPHAELWGIVFFSQIGGYPTGAQLLHSLYQEGRLTKQQEENLLCSCMGSGFGFLFATVGGNLTLALTLWGILSLPNFFLAWLILRSMPEQENFSLPERKNFSVLLTESVENAAAAMLKICGMILAFSAWTGIFNNIIAHLPEWAESILEISNLTKYMQNGGNLPTAVSLLSFGGICVHIQLATISENHFNWKKFWLSRSLTAGISGILCRTGMKFLFPESIPVFWSETKVSLYSAPSAIPTYCLILMSVFLLKKYNFFANSLTSAEK